MPGDHNASAAPASPSPAGSGCPRSAPASPALTPRDPGSPQEDKAKGRAGRGCAGTLGPCRRPHRWVRTGCRCRGRGPVSLETVTQGTRRAGPGAAGGRGPRGGGARPAGGLRAGPRRRAGERGFGGGARPRAGGAGGGRGGAGQGQAGGGAGTVRKFSQSPPGEVWAGWRSARRCKSSDPRRCLGGVWGQDPGAGSGIHGRGVPDGARTPAWPHSRLATRE